MKNQNVIGKLILALVLIAVAAVGVYIYYLSTSRDIGPKTMPPTAAVTVGPRNHHKTANVSVDKISKPTAADVNNAAKAADAGKSITPTQEVTPASKLRQNNLMPQPPAPGDAAIATVNGVPLSEKHFMNSLLRMNGLALLQNWIQLTILQQACQKAGLHVGKAQINAAEQDVLNQLSRRGVPDDELMPELKNILARKGKSVAEFRMDLARQAYMLALADGHVNVTADEVRQAFNASFGPKVEVRDIVVSNYDAAATVHHLIMDEHESPATVAQQYSMDRKTAGNGGLRIISLKGSSLQPILIDTAGALQSGQLSAPIQIGNTLHLLWLVKKIAPANVTLTELQAGIKAALLKQLKLRWGQIEMNHLEAQAAITINNPILNGEFANLRGAYAEEAQMLKSEQQAQPPASAASMAVPRGNTGK